MLDDHSIIQLTSPSAHTAMMLADAFQGDPALSWLLPNAYKRRRMLRPFFEVMAGQSHRHGTVLASSCRQAAALLYPAGKVEDGRLWDTLRLLRVFKTALPRGLKLAEAMYAHHPKPQPHLYLRYVGVAPQAQGQGLGGIILRDIIDRARRQGQGVLLETATPANVAIYSRLGFEISSEWEVPGGGPRFWTMIHPAP